MKHLLIQKNLIQLSFGTAKRLLVLRSSGIKTLDGDPKNYSIVDDCVVPKFSCAKCKIKGEEYPVYTPEYLELADKKRESDTERIVMFLIGAPMDADKLMDPEGRAMLEEWTREYLTADKVYVTPVAKCPAKSDPSKNTIQCCEKYLQHELLSIQPDVIVCLGKAAAVPFGLSGQAKELYNRVHEVKPLKYKAVKTDGSTVEIVTRPAKLLVTYSVANFVDDIKVRNSVEAAIKQAERLSLNPNIEPPQNYYLIESPKEFEEWVERHLTDERLKTRVHAFDIETNGWPVHPKTKTEAAHPPKLRCISYSWGPGMAICVPFERDPKGYWPLIKRFQESEIRFTAHNAAFDVFFLKYVNDIYTKHLAGDTMLMASMVNPGKGTFGYPLKPLAAEYTDLGGYETDMKGTPDEVDDSGKIIHTKWEIVDMEVMAPYNCADSDATLQIYHIFYKIFQERHMLPAHWVMTHALYPLGEMENNGFLVDKKWVDSSRTELEALKNRYEEELKVLCDGRTYDWGSPQALGMLMYQDFGYEVPQVDMTSFMDRDEDAGSVDMPTNDVALSMINTPFTQTIRKWRRAAKLLSTYFNGYFLNVGLDQRLRARFNLIGTVTGRLSSSGDANLQNIPSSMPHTAPGYEDLHVFKAKRAFIPRPGWVIVNADQSQLELRIAGAVSGEERFITSYKNNIDMHSRNARVSFGIDISTENLEEEALKLGFGRGSEAFNVYVERAVCNYIKKNYPEERQAAKSISFGILYGMSKWGLAQDLNDKGRDAGSTRIWTPDECGVLINKFKLGYPTLIRWQKGLIAYAKQFGYTYTVFGRRRYLPHIKDSNYSIRGKAERSAINTPVQSAGSDFMMTGVINMYQRLDPERFHFLATVHDSVVCEVKESYVDEFIRIAKECLERPMINGRVISLCNVMPFVAEFEAGDSYGTLEEYKVS